MAVDQLEVLSSYVALGRKREGKLVENRDGVRIGELDRPLAGELFVGGSSMHRSPLQVESVIDPAKNRPLRIGDRRAAEAVQDLPG
jgi:hypothetical protein